MPPKYGSCLWANVPRIGIDIEAHTHYATLLHSSWLLPLFQVWVGRAQLGWRERGYGAAEIRQLLVGEPLLELARRELLINEVFAVRRAGAL